ncbi:MAG: GDP-mannose 4,6-dehydratase, partial [Candidatus Odinarchaeota archaeon]
TFNILQAAREAGVGKIIHTSTSEVYGTAQFVPISEDHPINPQSPYAASKAGADYLALSYFRSFNLPLVIIRPFNTYGPRQSARAIIPTIVTQILSGKKNIELGSTYPTRDFTYVKDIINGFISATESNQSTGEIINIGSSTEITIQDLAELIAQITKIDIKIRIKNDRVRPKKSEVNRLKADTQKAKKLLEWSPQYTLESGLKETIEWFENNLTHYKSDAYNV